MQEKGEGNTGENNQAQNTGENQNPNTGSSDQSASSPSTPPSSSAPAASPAATNKPFPDPPVLNAVIDPKIKAKEGPVAFSFTKPQQVHQIYSQPSKGDVAKAAQTASAPGSKRLSLQELDERIALESKDRREYTADDYYDTAEMTIEGWEAVLTFFSRMISKDNSDSAYEFSEKKREKLIRQGAMVSRKRGWVIPIEASFLGNLLPASAGILSKAWDKRKQHMKSLEKDDASSKEVVNKGGPNKGFRKTRGPGRPRK